MEVLTVSMCQDPGVLRRVEQQMLRFQLRSPGVGSFW